MRYWDDFRYFPPSRPLAAKGGIRPQSQRGKFGESWWAKRWINVLEAFDLGGRLQRGRSYARGGQVLSIAVEKGAISATVQGSRPVPYKIKMQVKALKPAEWKKLAGAASSQAIFAAKLLAGEMPQEIESAFRDVGLSLFPERLNDLKTDCSCPDWSNPCKHIAAVYYLLGEEFDRDPFLIFKMRGMEREDFLAMIVEPSGASGPDEDTATALEPLPADPAIFWAVRAGSKPTEESPRNEQSAAALIKRLGAFPFWRGGEQFFDALEPVYACAATKVAEILAEE